MEREWDGRTPETIGRADNGTTIVITGSSNVVIQTFTVFRSMLTKNRGSLSDVKSNLKAIETALLKLSSSFKTIDRDGVADFTYSGIFDDK